MVNIGTVPNFCLFNDATDYFVSLMKTIKPSYSVCTYYKHLCPRIVVHYFRDHTLLCSANSCIRMIPPLYFFQISSINISYLFHDGDH